ncbi:MAG: clostripain-related cysteine peptidase [Candidatus Limiplasma sp.]|nr:clostripain-related cysteine peptidase [Candidatus Limiplasma sp.]
MRKALSILLALSLLLALAPAASAASASTFTLMVYLCGTDLESDGGMATADLQEMVASGVKPGGKLQVIIQSGGTKKWQTKGMKAREGERWTLDSEGLQRTESLGRVNMGDGDTLRDFLLYGIQNYPADRYGLVLWDHGGGATGGVCYDEITQDSLDMGELYDAFTAASKQAGYRKFAMVGFDACLMANYEMAVHLQPFADYMVASEETEPGEGWNYKSWLPTLAKDPGVSIEKLGKKIVDGFIQSILDAGYDEFGTLSVVDLSKIEPLRNALETMGESLTQEITGGNLNGVSRLRQGVRSFGETDQDGSDMIDLSVFASLYKTYDAADADTLMQALNDAVVYSRYTDNLSNVTGLSVLVPFTSRSSAEAYLQRYDTQNLMPVYTGFVRSLAAGMLSGSHTFTSTGVEQQSVQDATVDWFSQFAGDTQTYYDTYSNLWGGLSTGTQTTTAPSGTEPEPTADSGQDFSLDTFLNSLFGDTGESFNSDAYTANNLWNDLGTDNAGAVSSANFQNLWGDQTTEASDATVEVNAGGQTYTLSNPFADATGDDAFTLTLTPEDLQYLASAEASLMMDVSDADNGEMYVDFGYTSDVIVDWNQGKLYGLFDGTWPTLDGQMVCIYDQVSNENYVRSLIPVTLNGQDTYLLVVFDKQNPGGVVVGYTEGYTDAGIPARGYEQLQPGDVVIPQYDLLYWDDQDQEQYETFEGDPITVGADGSIPFGYDAVPSDAQYVYSFCLNDIFGGSQFTDFVTLSF